MVLDSDDTDSIYEIEDDKDVQLITLDEIYRLAKQISEEFDDFSKVKNWYWNISNDTVSLMQCDWLFDQYFSKVFGNCFSMLPSHWECVTLAYKQSQSALRHLTKVERLEKKVEEAKEADRAESQQQFSMWKIQLSAKLSEWHTK